MESRVESRVDSRVESRVEVKMESRVEAKMEENGVQAQKRADILDHKKKEFYRKSRRF